MGYGIFHKNALNNGVFKAFHKERPGSCAWKYGMDF